MDKRDLAAVSRTVEAMGPVLVRQSRVLDQAMRSAAEVAEALPPMEDVRAMAAAVETLPPMETVREVAAVTEVLPRMEVVRPMASITGEFSRTMPQAMRSMTSISALSDVMPQAMRSMTSISALSEVMPQAMRPMTSISALSDVMPQAMRSMTSISALSEVMPQAMRPMTSISALSRMMAQAARPVTTLVIRLVESFIAVYRFLKASAKQLADRMRSDPRPQLTHAGNYLECAWEDFGDGIVYGRISDDESYEAADAIGKTVGAIEELVCQIALMPAGGFRKAVGQLVSMGILNRSQAHEIRELYNIRSAHRGIAHGAAQVSNELAWHVLLDSVPIIRTILDAADIGTDRRVEVDGRVEWAGVPASV